LVFPEGHRVVFVPVVSKTYSDAGFLATNWDIWTLSLKIKGQNIKIIKTFTATNEADGKVVVIETPLTPKRDSDDHQVASPTSDGYTASCMYVASYGINLGCWVLPDNPFGYYYTTVYRYGYTNNPSSPSWWGCWQGSIHVCPRYETSGSPWYWVTCGFPPSHPQG
jgi:hypothetical protein